MCLFDACCWVMMMLILFCLCLVFRVIIRTFFVCFRNKETSVQLVSRIVVALPADEQLTNQRACLLKYSCSVGQTTNQRFEWGVPHEYVIDLANTLRSSGSLRCCFLAVSQTGTGGLTNISDIAEACLFSTVIFS